jgi:Protein of unknown function (DUF1588)
MTAADASGLTKRKSNTSRKVRDASSIALAIAMGGILGASAGGCGGRVVLGAQDDSGAAVVGAGGADAMAVNGQGGGTPQVDAASASRCLFSPDLSAVSAASTTSSTVVWQRIHQFLDDSPSFPSDPLPAQPTAAWAAGQASSILDDHFANGTEALGLVRFLRAWLSVPAGDAGPSASDTWSVKLLDPSATLTTLLAGPTGDPHRIGILTDPQVLTAYARISSRGAWMSANLLCLPVPPPPPEFGTVPPLATGTTERQWLEKDLNDPSCAGCHTLTDPPGFSLEHFDAMGNYRDLDNGSPVDSSGTFDTCHQGAACVVGVPLPVLTFTSILDLAPQLAVSCPVAQCFARLAMSDAFSVPLAISRSNSNPSPNLPFTQEEVNHVANAFADANFSIRALVKAIVGTPSFLR